MRWGQYLEIKNGMSQCMQHVKVVLGRIGLKMTDSYLFSHSHTLSLLLGFTVLCSVQLRNTYSPH